MWHPAHGKTYKGKESQGKAASGEKASFQNKLLNFSFLFKYGFTVILFSSILISADGCASRWKALQPSKGGRIC